MTKNSILECIHPFEALEFLVYATGTSRNKLFTDAGITSTSGYNCLKEGHTMKSSNWYTLVAKLPDNLYAMYLKLTTRVHKDTLLKGSLSYDPYLFKMKNQTPHPVTQVLVYLRKAYNLNTSEIASISGLSLDALRLYIVHGTQEPRLDRLRLILSAMPINIVYEFEWFMRNVDVQTPLTDFQYIKTIV